MNIYFVDGVCNNVYLLYKRYRVWDSKLMRGR